MYKVIAIMGMAGSGKDTILNMLVSTGAYNPIISYTTRPIRENEQEGKDYYFIEPEHFLDKIYNGDMLEHTNFNGWYYGTAKNALKEDKINIGVFNPAGILSLFKNKDIDLTVYEIITSDKERMLRQLEREENPDVEEIVRRFDADKEDFARFHLNMVKLGKEGQEMNFSVIINEVPGDQFDAVARILDKTC